MSDPDRIEPLGEAFVDDLALVVEALVFAADEPVPADQMAETYHTVTGLDVAAADVDASVERLNDAYVRTGRALRIHFWAGGYRMATVEAAAPYLKVMHQETRRRRLSRTLLETVAILAYRQPVTKPELDFVRGVDTGYAVQKLMEYGLVDVVGRSDSVGRPLLYGTTSRFLDLFGLASLDELPTLREIEELLADPAFKKERARLLFEQGFAGDGAGAAGTADAPAAADETEPEPGSGVDDTHSDEG